MASATAGNKSMYGYVFQANAYEGPDVQRARMGQVFWWRPDRRGRRHDLDQQSRCGHCYRPRQRGGSIRSRQRACWPTRKRRARGIWQTGNSVFMRNWPYAYALGNGSADSTIKGKFDVDVPCRARKEGQSSAATLGGWNLADFQILRNHPRKPIKLANCFLALCRAAEGDGRFPNRQHANDQGALRRQGYCRRTTADSPTGSRYSRRPCLAHPHPRRSNTTKCPTCSGVPCTIRCRAMALLPIILNFWKRS